MRSVHRVAGVVVVALLAGPAAVWLWHSVQLFAGCGGGLGNPGLTGRLDGGACLLSDPDRPLVRVPWTGDAMITILLLVALGCVVAATAARRRTVWSPLLPWLAVPALLVAGVSMGVRGRRRADGGVFDYVVHLPGDSPEGWSAGAVGDGWQLRSAEHTVLIPDVSALWLVVGFVAGLALIGFAVTALTGGRPPDAGQGGAGPDSTAIRPPAPSPEGSGSGG